MIKSIDDYNNHYKSSVKNPEKYWKEFANNFIWKKCYLIITFENNYKSVYLPRNY